MTCLSFSFSFFLYFSLSLPLSFSYPLFFCLLLSSNSGQNCWVRLVFLTDQPPQPFFEDCSELHCLFPYPSAPPSFTQNWEPCHSAIENFCSFSLLEMCVFFSVFIRMWYLSKVGKCYPAPIITFPNANPASVNMISLGYIYLCKNPVWQGILPTCLYMTGEKKCAFFFFLLPVYVSLYDPSHVIFRCTMTSTIRCDFPLILGFYVLFVQFIWFQFQLYILLNMFFSFKLQTKC